MPKPHAILVASLIPLMGLFAGPAAAQKEVVLNFPVAVGGPITEIIDGYAQEFNQEHPDIRVVPVYTGTYQDTITRTLTQIRGGDSPAMAVLMAVDFFTLYDEGVLAAIDDLIEDEAEREQMAGFFPAFMENGQLGEDIWSIPFQRSTPVMFWNKDAFAAADLDPESPPITWDEQVEIAKALTRVGENGNPAPQWGLRIPSAGFPYAFFQAMATQQDTRIVSDDGTEVFFTEPGAIAGLEYWVSLGTEHRVMQEGVIDWGATPRAFLDGESAIIWTTTGNLANVRDNAEFNFGVAMLPAGIQRGSATGGGNLFIFNKVPEEVQRAAFRFALWLTQPERAADWSIRTGYVAVSSAAWETKAMKDYVASFPAAAVARDQLDYAVAEFSTYENQRVTQILNDAIQSALTGERSPAEALEAAQAAADAVLAPYR